MENATQIVLNLFPVLALFVVGYVLRRTHFFEPSAVSALKKLVVNIALPALLFRAFASLNLEPRLLLVVITVFSICVVMVLIGRVISWITGIKSPYFAILMGGFETGMVGYAIFIAAYGAENVPALALVDLGQVTFVFFVLMSLLISLRGERYTVAQLTRRLISSPVIIAIAAGMVFGLVTAHVSVEETALFQAASRLITLVGGLTVPLICIVIGYELEIDRSSLGLPLFTIAVRTVLLVGFAVVVNALLIRHFLGLPSIYERAVLTMFILPPPFVIPLFMDQTDRENMRYVTNTLSMGTLASAGVFIAASFVLV